MDVLMITLRLVHIVLGVLWAGWAFSLALFVEPASRIAGPGAGPFMQALTGKTPLVRVMMIAPLFVIGSGLWMYWIVSGGFNSAWIASVHGTTLTLGSVIGIGTFVYGILMVRPLALRMGTLAGEIGAAGQPPSADQLAEMQVLRTNMRVRGLTIGILLAVCVALMAAARYVI